MSHRYQYCPTVSAVVDEECRLSCPEYQINPDDFLECPTCEGEGRVERLCECFEGDDCPCCFGEHLYYEPCDECKGTGIVDRDLPQCDNEIFCEGNFQRKSEALMWCVANNREVKEVWNLGGCRVVTGAYKGGVLDDLIRKAKMDEAASDDFQTKLI